MIDRDQDLEADIQGDGPKARIPMEDTEEIRHLLERENLAVRIGIVNDPKKCKTLCMQTRKLKNQLIRQVAQS